MEWLFYAWVYMYVFSGSLCDIKSRHKCTTGRNDIDIGNLYTHINYTYIYILLCAQSFHNIIMFIFKQHLSSTLSFLVLSIILFTRGIESMHFLCAHQVVFTLEFVDLSIDCYPIIDYSWSINRVFYIYVLKFRNK